MGWDAFGLPAENAAIERGIPPEKWTRTNIHQMKRQLQELGFDFNWRNELATCDPEYYKWTQYIFVKLWKAGLVYQDEAIVNWDPVDQTVLANEQVDENGLSWRSGCKVEKLLMKQWFIKTTKYSKKLLEALDTFPLENWQGVINMQKHWLGQCDGYLIELRVANEDQRSTLSYWTDRPEQLKYTEFLAVSSSHKFNKKNLISYYSDDLPVLTLKALNPLTGHLMPIVVTDDVQFHKDASVYGGTPGLSELDKVMCERCGLNVANISHVDSGAELSREAVLSVLREKGVEYYPSSCSLGDWVISRQRYWGTPIPVIHCSSCGPVPVPEEDLPVKLPQIDYEIKKGENPLKDLEWNKCSCPICGQIAKREVDTMDTFIDSSWYFLRYLDPHNDNCIFDKQVVDNFMPVDLYIGGAEHTVLHLYYARFIQHFLADQGFVTAREPFPNFLATAIVKGEAYRVESTGEYLPKSEVDFSVKPPISVRTKQPVRVSVEKMSKSKYNGIDPEAVLNKYGVDTTRLIILTAVNPNSPLTWPIFADVIKGVLNWQHRFWLLVGKFIESKKQPNLLEENHMSQDEWKKHIYETRNYGIMNVTYDMEHTHQIRTVLTHLYKYTTNMLKVPVECQNCPEFEYALADIIVMAYPVMPHLAQELWEGFCSVATNMGSVKVSLDGQEWPKLDSSYQLKLICRIGKILIWSEQISQEDLRRIEESEAIDRVRQQDAVRKALGTRQVDHIEFVKKSNHSAVVILFTKSE